jgi:hypothetical protein
MTVRGAVRAWNDFFFAPQSPAPVCLFRVLFGLLTTADLLLLRPDWLTWFGTRGMLTLDGVRHFEPGTRINLFVFFSNDTAVQAFFWFALTAAVFLTVGFLTRASSIAVFICLASMNQRALFAMHAGDSLLRVTGFWLMFAPAGAALSVDRLLRIWRGKEGLEIAPRPPWAQRMIQFQISILYLGTFWLKSQGPTWIDGTALYYVYHLEQFERFPVPSFLQDLAAVKLDTWLTLALEFALGVLIWFKELRYPLLLMGVALHLSLEYAMNIPLFQWIILATYVTFIEPTDLARAWNWLRARMARRFGAPVTVVYDGASERALRTVNVLRGIDFLGRLRFVELAAETPERGRTPKDRLVVSSPAQGVEALARAFSKRHLTVARAAK